MNDLDDLLRPLSREGAQQGPPVEWIFERVRWRRARRRLLGVAVVVAVLAAGVPLWRAAIREPDQVTTVGEADDPDPSPPVSDGPEDGDGEEGSAGRSVRAVDQGFTLDESDSGELESVSYGVVVHNPADQVAVGVRLQARFVDQHNDAEVLTDSTTLAVVLPGEAFGFGREVVPEEPGAVTDTVAMQVEVSEPECWWSDGAGDVTVGDVAATWLDDQTSSVTTFQASSTFNQELVFDSWAVYRDASGRILGGSESVTPLIPPGGTVTGEILSFVPLPDADLSRTDVFVDRRNFSTLTGDDESACPGGDP